MVVVLEAGASLETPDERVVQRHRGDDGPVRAVRADNLHLPRHRHRVAPADLEAAGSLH